MNQTYMSFSSSQYAASIRDSMLRRLLGNHFNKKITELIRKPRIMRNPNQNLSYVSKNKENKLKKNSIISTNIKNNDYQEKNSIIEEICKENYRKKLELKSHFYIAKKPNNLMQNVFF